METRSANGLRAGIKNSEAFTEKLLVGSKGRNFKSMKKLRNFAFLFLFLGTCAYIFISFYSYIFSRTVDGPIVAVERVTPPMAIMTGSGQALNQQVFSFAVGVRDERTGEIVTGSTEDRQWAVASPGQCATAEFFPYPPWDFPKWGTYYNVRLVKLRDCPPGTAPETPQPVYAPKRSNQDEDGQLFGE